MTDAPPLMRKLLANIATYGLGDFLTKGSIFFTLPIYTRLLSVSEFGTWNLILTTSGIVQTIFALGGDVVYLRFFFTAKDDADRQLITSTWFGFLALWTLSLVLLGLPFVETFSYWVTGDTLYAPLILLALVNLPLTLMNTLSAQVLVNQFRARDAVRLNVLATILVIVFNILAALRFGVLGFFLASLFTNLIMITIRLWTIRSLLRFRFSSNLLRQMVAYGVPIVPGSLAFWVFASSDRLLLSKLSSLEQVGLYAIANQIANGLALFISSLQQAWTPQAIEIYEKQPEHASRIYGQILSYILLAFGLLSVIMAAVGREMIMLLSSPAYYAASQAIGPLALGFVFFAGAQVTYLGITVKKKTHLLAIVPWGAALVNIILNLLLIPRFGYIATAWSTAAAYAVLMLSYLFVSQRYFPVLYERYRGLVIVTLTIIFIIGVNFLPELALLPGLALKSVYVLAYAALLVMCGAVNQREFTAVSTLVRQLRARVAG
jgi:O-antigen/teichoic acid export membrane protein